MPISRIYHRMRRNGGLPDIRRQLATRCTITEALVPPKPNEFDSATLISRLRGTCGTRSIAVSTEDRKSTRLNSSHLGISYAVFCLKKKNTHLRHHASTTASAYFV